MRNFFRLALLTMFTTLVCSVSFAQVTTSSLGGRVVDEDGNPVVGAAIVATHTPSGTVYGSVTNADGRYAIQGMRPGGPYNVEVSDLGYQGITYTDVTLQLGEVYSLNAVIKESSLALGESIVVASAASKFAAEKTGASTNISNEQMLSMPTVSRSVTDIAKLSPYGGNGMSFSGADGRNVNFTVDGANFNNNFGLSSSLPGGGTPISLDAIEEMQVVISPFDVRQTNFIGGGVNAITKSGTNSFKGTAYVYHQNENMHGNRVYNEELSAREKDRTTTYGFTLGGPIIKNKLFFFVNGEYVKTPTTVNRWRASEDGVMDVDNFISRVTTSDMELVRNKLKNDYGYDTGSYTSFPADITNKKVLARIDWNITDNHHLAVRYNHTDNETWYSPNASSSNANTRPQYARMSQYGMSFANSMYSMHNKVDTWSIDLNSRFGENLSNQFLATYSKIGDVRGSNSSKFPFIDILENDYNEDGTISALLPYISAGYELFTWNNAVHNNTLTVKDDLTWYKGDHKVTLGVSFEHQMADNQYMRNGTGYYRYSSLDDFLNEAAPETVAITYGYDGEEKPAARVRFNQVGLYLQDDWNITENFKLNYGIRFDDLIFNEGDVDENLRISSIDYGGRTINTGKWPKSRIQISPRVGFNWDVLGNNLLKLRGGTGMFVGRLPLVFFTNMPSNSGMVQNVAAITTTYSGGVGNPNEYLSQFAGKMITNTDELINKLNSLNAGQFPTSKPTTKDGGWSSAVNAVDPKFKMPQVWKTSIAFDLNLPTSFPLTITGEFTFNKTVHAVTMKNWAIMDNEGWSTYNGPDNRHVYPSQYKYTYTYNQINNDGTLRTDKDGNVLTRTGNVPNAYVLSNTNKGYGWISMFSVSAEPVKGLKLYGAYTHTVSKELTGMPGSNAASTMEYIPSVEGANFLSLHTSQYVNPDRVIASVSYSDRGNNHYSLFYEGIRYGGYSFIYSNDVNNDGMSYDALYIPKNKGEIRYVSEADADAFWAYVNQDSYLKKHKGEYAEAYDVATPMRHTFDFRYAHDFDLDRIFARSNTHIGTIQVSLDIQNLGNLFNSKWGVSKRLYTNTSYATPLRLDHVDPDGVPVFASNVTASTKTWEPSKTYGNCWYMQIGVKYIF